MTYLLVLIARHGKLMLVAGLIAGLLLPSLASVIRAWLPELIALLLFQSAIRIGPKAALGSLSDAGESVGLVLLFQLCAPFLLLLVLIGLGLEATPAAIACR